MVLKDLRKNSNKGGNINEYKNENYTLVEESSLCNGAELRSPILIDTYETWVILNKMCESSVGSVNPISYSPSDFKIVILYSPFNVHSA